MYVSSLTDNNLQDSSQGVSFAVSDPALSPAAAMATQPVAVPPDSHAFVGKLPRFYLIR